MRRRTFMRAVGAGTTTVGMATAASLYTRADEAIDYDDTFEKHEWGYVRRDWDAPDGDTNPIVYRHDGYNGASFASDGPTHYVRMPDDTLVATKISPSGRPTLPGPGSDPYIRVESSVRGTACSSGTEADYGEAYNVLSHGDDGVEIVEWLADRPWALDRIGLWGISYSGMIAIRIASRDPPSLACVSANVIMGDILRGRTFPGGVDNLAFDTWLENLPTLWWDDDHDSRDIVPDDDPLCQDFYGNRDHEDIIDQHPDWYRERVETSDYRRINFVRMARHIRVPTHITQAWQDGQTGQRGGPAVFNALDPDPVVADDLPGTTPPSSELQESPKLLRATNGYHGPGVDYLWERDAKLWFDYWLRGHDTGIMQEAPVRLDFNRDGYEDEGSLEFDAFPPTDTDWVRLYFGAASTLSRSVPPTDSMSYTSAIPQYWFRDDLTSDDVLTFWTPPFEEPRVIAGTPTVTLFMESDADNTEMYVSVGDIDPDTEHVTYVQRGMLRASHRELDEERTDRNEDGAITRPVHTMTDPESITPGEISRYDIEVFPFSHILYPGHRLLINIHAPPLEEGPDDARQWEYDPLENGAENTLHCGEDHRSSVLLPVYSPDDVPPEPDCGAPEGYNCIDVTFNT